MKAKDGAGKNRRNQHDANGCVNPELNQGLMASNYTGGGHSVPVAMSPPHGAPLGGGAMAAHWGIDAQGRVLLEPEPWFHEDIHAKELMIF